MIYLEVGQNNEFFVSCSRNKTLSNPTYLFNFHHKQSGEDYYVIPYKKPSIVTYNERYDTFYIDIDYDIAQSLTGNTGNTLTNVHLQVGEYWLNIYEQNNPNNLDPMSSYDIVMETNVIVQGNQDNDTTYGDDIYKYKIYE